MTHQYPKRLLVLVCVAIVSVTATYLYTRPYSGWVHLELGAGNYGDDGHTQISQRKTVAMKIEVSEKPNYIDTLPQIHTQPYEPQQQFAVLFWTLDELVKRRGAHGVFHVNDLVPEYAEVATKHLKAYAKSQGYNHIIVEAIPGDYAQLDVKQALAKYKLNLYDSVHLKNPEISFFSYKLDGDDILANEQSRSEGRALLQHLANYSKCGLYFFPIHHKNFIPEEETEAFIDKQIFYQPTETWPAVAYYYPEGPVISKDYGAVFFIKRAHS